MREQDLPQPYREMMRQLLGEEYSFYIGSLAQESFRGLRVNTGKIDSGEFQRRFPMELSQVPWCQNGFLYEGEMRPSLDPYYSAGLFYLQEPSAMAPAAMLPVSPGERVLDLCAAPGGKSTELGARLAGRGLLHSNDISASRAGALLKNLELFGLPNICVTCEQPSRLADTLGEYFDKVLVDAPCSGQGTFRRDPEMLKSYRECGPDHYVQIQREIILQAAKLLRPGGMLLYSTCTFSICENEEIIRYLMERRGDMRVIPLLELPGTVGGIGLPGCLRFFPHKLKGEGHFVALLRKTGGNTVEKPEGTSGNRGVEPPQSVREFFERISWELDKTRIFINKDKIYYLPENYVPFEGLRYLRTGLLLGELKRDRFEPSQALAMALKREEFRDAFSMARGDERVIRYLKGETILLEAKEPDRFGWQLVCVDEFPLGFAKGSGRTLKNKYSSGWRRL